jgi:predicted nucleotidyltransferase
MIKLDELLGQRKAWRLLLVFLRHPSNEFLQRELRKKTGLSKATLIKWLGVLHKHDLLGLKKKGNVHLYTLQKEDPVIRHLKVMDTLIRIRTLRTVCVHHGCEAFLYGSAARGEDSEDSDIDILLIGKISRLQIIDEVDAIAQKIGKRISLQLFTSMEWAAMAKKDPAFFERVEHDKVNVA